MEEGHGLNKRDWNRMKDALLAASCNVGRRGCPEFDALPERLREHPIGKLIEAAVHRNNRAALNKAARELTGMDKGCWLMLDKS